MAAARRWSSAIVLVLAIAGLTAALAWAARINGTERADTLRGTPAADKIYGKGGNDRLYGLGGNDLLVGGPGLDRVFCGAGRDRVQADRSDRVARDCESVRRPQPPAPPEPPTTTSVVDFRVCPQGETIGEGAALFCGTNRAGSTISGASRIYCTARIANGAGKSAQLAFLRGGAQVVQTDPFPMTRDNLYTFVAIVDSPQAGSWSCQAKVNGATLREIAFTVG